MRSLRLLLLVLTLSASAGCNPRQPADASHAGTAIAVGQPWARAKGIAARAGYELHDASQLAMEPTPDGFYIDMPGRRGLIVYRDPDRDEVASMTWVENWPGPKKPRVYHDVPSFEVPPADPAMR